MSERDPFQNMDPEVRRRLVMARMQAAVPPQPAETGQKVSSGTVLAVAAAFGLGGIVLGVLLASGPGEAARDEGNENRPAAQAAPSELPEAPAVPEIGVRRVKDVVAADMVILDGIGIVQLLGVDAKRLPDGARPDPTIGREVLRRLVAGGVVKAEYDPATANTDHKNALGVPLVYLRDMAGTLVNERVIAEGGAVADVGRDYEKQKDLLLAEIEAKSAGLGIWAVEVAPLVESPDAPAVSLPPVARPGDLLVTSDGRFHRQSCPLGKGGTPTAPAAARGGGNTPCPQCMVSGKIST